MSATPITENLVKITDELGVSDKGFIEELIDLARQLETELAEARAEIERLKNENESLMFLVKNQRCCRNCGNHASWNFDTCGFGENPKDSNEGPECRRNDLKRWRPMEYRYAKAALAAERGGK